MDVGKRIKTRRKALGYSAEDLAAIIGVSPATIYRYESADIMNMRSDKLNPIAKALRTTPAYLMGWEDDPDSPSSENTPVIKSEAPIRIPVLGSIPAGIPIEAIEDILDWEELPASMGKGGAEYFALQVKGDSMFPNYLDGDVLIFRKQETCNSGQDCAVMVNGDDATFKRVKIGEKGITLQPLNPAYDPMYFTREECAEIPVRIIGVVVELRRKI
jgi:repressor LexA